MSAFNASMTVCNNSKLSSKCFSEDRTTHNQKTENKRRQCPQFIMHVLQTAIYCGSNMLPMFSLHNECTAAQMKTVYRKITSSTEMQMPNNLKTKKDIYNNNNNNNNNKHICKVP